MARGAHIPPGYIYRKMPYLKLMAMLRCLEDEAADRRREEREAKLMSRMNEMKAAMRRGY